MTKKAKPDVKPNHCLICGDYCGFQRMPGDYRPTNRCLWCYELEEKIMARPKLAIKILGMVRKSQKVGK